MKVTTTTIHSKSFYDAQMTTAAWASVNSVLAPIHTVRDQAATKPAPKKTEHEGCNVRHVPRLVLDIRAHVRVTVGTLKSTREVGCGDGIARHNCPSYKWLTGDDGGGCRRMGRRWGMESNKILSRGVGIWICWGWFKLLLRISWVCHIVLLLLNHNNID